MKRRAPISRRTFLKLTATMAAGAALASCTPKPSSSLPIETAATGATPTVLPSATVGVIATETTPAEATPAGTNPTETASHPEPTPTTSQAYMSVVHGPDPAAITRAAIDALGGMASFVSSGFDVIIKPNICTDYHPPEYATTTNPIVMGTLVSMCLEAGAKRVRVMDYPFGGTPRSAYEISGIAQAVEAAGGEMHIMSRPKYTLVDIPMGKSLTKVQIYPDILEADLLINVPIAKHHGSTRLTLGEKNLMGVILDRNLMHVNLSQRIADLTSLVRPALTGADIGYIPASAELGLGTMDLSGINIQEITVG
jgi:hypothetical protein